MRISEFLGRHHPVAALMLGASLALAACSNSDSTSPTTPPPGSVQFTSAQISSLDSSAQAIVQANPGNADLKSLVDSALTVLTAGIQARKVDVSTDLTTAPLYFVGIHRAVARATGSYSTWTLVGMDDPSKLANLVEVSGFAQTSGTTPPASVNGTIGDGTGIVNGMLLQVAAGGAVTQWRASSGTVSFSSDTPGAACPGFVATAVVTCTMETMHVHFAMTAPNVGGGSGGAGTRQATLSTDTAIPTMLLTYRFP